MITVEGGELVSEVRDLRDVPFGEIGAPGERMLEDNLRRIVPDRSATPTVPVAAFSNFV
ncbi:hypothetical protein [Nonomuraea sp. NPDC050786]|uniref:hypothetical protein n=1 Tax=Nonomuraea sp. NPDC050786 TaxID=3154840 RepID=UPI0033C8575B